ncbi:hypothetical protein [Streptomyces sp. NPDC086989]|uniref:hypothetical protein n=1 Tax=Streptomyces sp. NPDC086989 TaxID=3365764 RepID=UPI0037F15886
MRKALGTVLASVALTVGSTVALAAPASAADNSAAGAAAAASGTAICYQAHVRNIGWQGTVCNGTMAGTTGKNLGIEALTVATAGTGGLCLQAHVQNIGWQNKVCAADGQNVTVGTTGQGLNIEALIISTGTGVSANGHFSNYGWTGWSGYAYEVAIGSTGQNRAMEAIALAV